MDLKPVNLKYCYSYTIELVVLNLRRHLWNGRIVGNARTASASRVAAIADAFDGVNSGQNAGRYCWAVAGTLCKGEIQGTFARKFRNCLACSFYLSVERDEGSAFTLLLEDFSI